MRVLRVITAPDVAPSGAVRARGGGSAAGPARARREASRTAARRAHEPGVDAGELDLLGGQDAVSHLGSSVGERMDPSLVASRSAGHGAVGGTC